MKKNDLTVIIPCYNIEKYIEKCLNSIYKQTYKNFNIILINDNSIDSTLDKITAYSKNVENITIINNKKNKGTGYSRNKALEICKTKYVTFVDGDDYLEKKYYEIMMNKIVLEKSDICVCDIYIKYENKEIIDILESACQKKVTKENIINNGLAASPCNKIFKTKLIKESLFAENIINEDIPSVISSLIKANKVSYTNETYYNYIQRDTSVQNTKITIKKFDLFKSIDILKKRISKEKYFNKYMDIIIMNQIILFLLYIIPKEKNFIKRYKILKNFNKKSKKYNFKKNIYFQEFLNKQSKLHSIYYKCLVNLISSNMIILANTLILFYQLYKKYFTKNVLEKKYSLEILIKKAKKKKYIKNLSVIIPNYNYSKFLYQRLYSILNQKYLPKEIIILDDSSNDDSQNLINLITESLSKYITIKKIYNKKNSGSAFKQWKKGIEVAKGKYIWIAEADDYCDNKFLKSIFRQIDLDKDIVLAYTNTAFINKEGNIIQRSVVNDIDLQKTGHFNNNYINDGIDEIKKYSYLNCTIANVSSLIFKKTNIDMDEITTFKQAGDWYFYLMLMKKGKVAFIKKAHNFYRMHGSNATSVNKKNLHFKEINRIHTYLRKNEMLNKEQELKIKERYRFLKEIWQLEDIEVNDEKI